MGSYFIFLSPPAPKEPGKARANSLVCLGSQRGSGLFHKQVTVARQASLPGSPQVLRNPLRRQKKVGCYADDASDEEFEGEGDCISLPGSLPGAGRPPTEDDSRHGLTSPKVMGVNNREDHPQKTLVSKASSVPLLGSSLSLESVPGDLGDTPPHAANPLSSAEAPKGGSGCLRRKELPGSRSSPKLEYKADTQSLVSADSASAPQQRSESVGCRHRPVARVSPHCKGPEASARPTASETVNLTAGGNDPQDLESKAQAASVHETMSGFRPGGAVEKVTEFLLGTWDLGGCCVNEGGECYNTQGMCLKARTMIGELSFVNTHFSALTAPECVSRLGGEGARCSVIDHSAKRYHRSCLCMGPVVGDGRAVRGGWRKMLVWPGVSADWLGGHLRKLPHLSEPQVSGREVGMPCALIHSQNWGNHQT